MTYFYVAVASIGDPAMFAEASTTWAGERLRGYGAIDFTTSEVVMGGEMATTNTTVVGRVLTRRLF